MARRKPVKPKRPPPKVDPATLKTAKRFQQLLPHYIDRAASRTPGSQLASIVEPVLDYFVKTYELREHAHDLSWLIATNAWRLVLRHEQGKANSAAVKKWVEGIGAARRKARCVQAGVLPVRPGPWNSPPPTLPLTSTTAQFVGAAARADDHGSNLTLSRRPSTRAQMPGTNAALPPAR